MPKVLIKFVLLLTLLGGVNVLTFAQCGPDAYAPVVSYKTQQGLVRKVVRRARSQYESFASYQFEQNKLPNLGFHAHKFDNFGQIRWCDLQARLDNLAIHAQTLRGTQISIIAYGGYGQPKDELMKRVYASYSKNYLTFTRGVEEGAVVTVNGGEADEFRIELWVGPYLTYNTSDTVEMPSSSYQSYSGGHFTITVPENWRRLDYMNVVLFAPVGAFKGPGVFSHGIEIRHMAGSGAFYDDKEDGKFPYGIGLTSYDPLKKTTIAGHEAIMISSSYIPTGTKTVQRVVSYCVKGLKIPEEPGVTRSSEYSVVCIITAAPMYEYPSYQPTFDRILESFRFTQ